MRLILRQRPVVPKYVHNVTSRAPVLHPVPHRPPVPASAVVLMLIAPMVLAIVIPDIKEMHTQDVQKIPVPTSAVPQTRAALTDVLLTPVLHPAALKFVPLVIRNRIPVPVHHLLRLPVQNRQHLGK